MSGEVVLVGAGPGAVDLITVRGLRELQAADVVFYDSLANPELLRDLTAECIYVGKRCGHHSVPQDQINQMMAAQARAGRRVVRLKGGDPMVLGRGGEEARWLEAEGVAVRIVPGVSNCIAAAELAGISVTHRGVADAFVVASAHRRHDELEFAIPRYHPRTTLVLLMGVRTMPYWRQQLLDLGYPLELPVAFVTRAGHPDMEVCTTTVGDCLALHDTLRTPTTAVVGRVVAMRAWLENARDERLASK